MKKTVGCVLLALMICCSFLPFSARAAGDVPQAVLDLRQSVVRIVCQTSDGYYTGSGFAIGTEEPIKYIVTNLHVVAPNPDGVTILRENNREIPTKVYLEIENADLCVLLLDEALYGVPPVNLQDGKNASVGQAVYALGFPGAADIISDTMSGKPEDVTITDGIVSAVKSFTYIEKGTPIDLLQINAAISHGNSGGPLVDEKGAVLGVNSLGVSDAQNINGAVSILELTGALKERGVPYLSSEEKSAGFPVMTAVIVAGSVLLAALIALFIVLTVRRARKGRKTAAPAPTVADVPLQDYLRQWGGRLPYDMAARLLAPTLQRLAAMHQAGRVHGDVCPENIAVVPAANQALLQAPEAATGVKIVLRPGYSAPEQYRADGRIGPWSDVYSISAVFYYVVTGKAPLGVMERMAPGADAVGYGEANIDPAHGSALLAGLALDAAARPQNVVELANSLGVDLAPAPQEAAAPIPSPIPAAVAQPIAAKPPKKRMKTGKKLLIAVLATLFVLCAGAGGYYLYNDSVYNKAIECIKKQDYKGGVDDLTHVLRIFKDAEKWINYACAGDALQQNNFSNARIGFTGLKNFNDADKMLKEVDYLEAYYLLSIGKFDQATKLFTSLNDYKDSKRMLTEVDYQRALSLLAANEYDKARDILEILAKNKYKDSETYYVESIYLKGIDLYKQDKLEDAYKIFSNIKEYRDSSKYLDTIRDDVYRRAISCYRSRKYYECKQYLNMIDS